MSRSNPTDEESGEAAAVSDGQLEARELAVHYLPLDRQRAARFLDDWEPTVRAQLRRLRAEEDAVLYRVFDRALGALPSFRGESRLSTWLYRITYREALRHLGKQKRLASREAPLEAAETLPAAADADPERCSPAAKARPRWRGHWPCSIRATGRSSPCATSRT
jgi:RNA polymerase sigma-70 factor (ECF subfamily)